PMLPGTVTCSATSPDRPADSASAITGTSPARPTRLASSNSAEKSWDTRTTSAPVAQRYGTLDKSHYRWPQEHLAVTTPPPDRRIQGQSTPLIRVMVNAPNSAARIETANTAEYPPVATTTAEVTSGPTVWPAVVERLRMPRSFPDSFSLGRTSTFSAWSTEL